MIWAQPTDEDINPFSPTFGQAPRTLVGRDAILVTLTKALNIGPRSDRFTSLLLGPRGSGKTAVLNALEQAASQNGWFVLPVDATTRNLLDRIRASAAKVQQQIQSIEISENRGTDSLRITGVSVAGVGISWEPKRQPDTVAGQDLRLLLDSVASAANSLGTGVLLTVDELHAGHRQEVRRLCSDIQHITKRAELPLAFVGAGLAEMSYTLLEDRKMTFLQRCSRMSMPPLTEADALRGLQQTVRLGGGTIEREALRVAAAAVGASPYKLQLIGSYAWVVSGAPDSQIDLDSVHEAIRLAAKDMEARIAIPAWHDLGETDQRYLRAVVEAETNATPRAVGCAMMDVSAADLRRSKSRLVASGYLSETEAGFLELTQLVPAATVRKMITEAEQHRTQAEESDGRASRETAGLCRKWMPRARASCVLKRDHNGPCRSSR